ISTDSGIEKLPFSQLPESVRAKYGYDAKRAAQYSNAVAAAERERALKSQQTIAKQTQKNAEQSVAADRERRTSAAARKLETIRIRALVRPFYFGDNSTMAEIRPIFQQAELRESRGLDMVDTYS